jgi:hypothetical protein
MKYYEIQYCCAAESWRKAIARKIVLVVRVGGGSLSPYG